MSFDVLERGFFHDLAIEFFGSLLFKKDSKLLHRIRRILFDCFISGVKDVIVAILATKFRFVSALKLKEGTIGSFAIEEILEVVGKLTFEVDKRQ